ncbi:hypothetical protein K457DRAFT_79092, partial [Linnemannia elongata AG-77]
KYITFLPHSGFHNQRTELENALLLARLLNRTLIMPKVYLGPPMPWLTFPMLHSRLLYQTKIGLEHCRAIIESQVDPLPAECLQYESWTMTDWDLFFDLDPLRHYVRILTRESMSMAYLETDVLFFDDTSLYDYRFSESPNATESLKTRSKFVQEFTIDWLAQRPERLIHLGSIFGTGRVAIESLEAKAWLQMIRDHLIIRTEILQTTSQRIADKISGRAGFVGIHIRMSDGHFSLTARDTIENIRQELISGSTPLLAKKQGRLSIEQCHARALNHRWALQEQLLQRQQQDRERERELGHHLMKSPPSPNQEQHQQPLMQIPTTDSDPTSQPKRRSNGRYTPIYLATDAHRPRSNTIFDRLFATFDCIFTLDDFTEDLEPLTQYRNPEDGTLMTKFLIPMVDAMVVAKAAAFFGTPASTFSNYIQRQLRPAYTGLYD